MQARAAQPYDIFTPSIPSPASCATKATRLSASRIKLDSYRFLVTQQLFPTMIARPRIATAACRAAQTYLRPRHLVTKAAPLRTNVLSLAAVQTRRRPQERPYATPIRGFATQSLADQKVEEIQEL